MMIRFILLIAILTVCSCSTSPHENFKNHLGANINMRIDDPSALWAGPEDFIGAQMLANGNVENQYEWRNCLYFFEYEEDTKKIVSWRFEGSEKDCAIVP